MKKISRRLRVSAYALLDYGIQAVGLSPFAELQHKLFQKAANLLVHIQET
jgi:hypothetical protein